MPICGSARSASRIICGLAPEDRVLAVLPLSFDYGQNQLLLDLGRGRLASCRSTISTARDVIRAVERHRDHHAGRRSSALGATDRGALAGRGRAVAAPADQQRRQARALGGPADARALPGRRHLFDVRPDRGVPLDLSRSGLARQPSRFDGHGDPVRRDHGGRRRRRREAARRASWSMPGRWSRKGYWQDPARTAERFKPAPAASAYGGMAVWSGDRVRRDADGLLYFVGREDGMIKTSGNRVSPTEIEEAALASRPGRRGGRARLSRRAAGRGDRPDRPPRPARRGGGAARLSQAPACPISCSPGRSSGATSCRAAPTASSTGSR